MERIQYRISLDMFDTVSQKTLKAKKGDTACDIIITLTENGKVYQIAEGCSATFTARKSDGNFLYNAETCSIEGNTIIYSFTGQTTACEGMVDCEVVLYGADSNRLTSPRFSLLVGDIVYNGEDIISTPEADAFRVYIGDIAELNRIVPSEKNGEKLKGYEVPIGKGDGSGEMIGSEFLITDIPNWSKFTKSNAYNGTIPSIEVTEDDSGKVFYYLAPSSLFLDDVMSKSDLSDKVNLPKAVDIGASALTPGILQMGQTTQDGEAFLVDSGIQVYDVVKNSSFNGCKNNEIVIVKTSTDEAGNEETRVYYPAPSDVSLDDVVIKTELNEAIDSISTDLTTRLENTALKNKWRFINEVTLTEGAPVIISSLSDGETPFALKKFKVFVQLPNLYELGYSSPQTVWLSINGFTVACTASLTLSETGTPGVYFCGERDPMSKWRFSSVANRANAATPAAVYEYPRGHRNTGDLPDSVVSLSISRSSDMGASLPTGTTVKVYGVDYTDEENV